MGAKLKTTSDIEITPSAEKPSTVLTARQLEVLRHIAMGKTNQEISRDLYISEHTVANHVRHILEKIDATNRIDAATFAVRYGLDENR